MQVWPRAACCDVRETERVRGRKREVRGGEEGWCSVHGVSLHMDTYMCRSTRARLHTFGVDIIQRRQRRVCTG